MSDHASESANQSSPHGDSGLGLTQVTQSPVPVHLANPRQRQAILARIAEGERILDIAQDIGIPRSTLSWQLRKHAKDDYMAARHTKAEALLDDAIDGMQEAEDALALARARETFNAARFLAEREHPERWGARPTSQVNVSGQGVTVQLVQFGVAPEPHGAVHTVDNDVPGEDADSK